MSTGQSFLPAGRDDGVNFAQVRNDGGIGFGLEFRLQAVL